MIRDTCLNTIIHKHPAVHITQTPFCCSINQSTRNHQLVGQSEMLRGGQRVHIQRINETFVLNEVMNYSGSWIKQLSSLMLCQIDTNHGHFYEVFHFKLHLTGIR